MAGAWALTLVVPIVFVVGAPTASAAVTSSANPPIEDSCGLNATLVLDASGSISSSGAVDDVRNAAGSFLDALNNTDSTARVTQFATISQELAPRTQVDDASLGQGGVLGQAVADYYNPKPPRPSGVTIYRYDGSGNSQSSGNYREDNGSNQYTNWDQSLDQAGQEASELVVYVTDGDPTAFDFNQSGDPFDAGPPPDVAVQTDRSEAAQATLDRAVQEANQIKDAQTRILAVGVGSALSNSSSRDRLEAISGPKVVRDADLATIDSLNDVDVALVTNFKDLAAFLRSVVLQLCSPSMTIRKLAQTADDATYQPAPGWEVTVTPTVPGGTFAWVLPDTAPATSKTVSTNAGGFAQFQWEPDPAESDSRAVVQEDLQPGYVAGRPPDAGLPADAAADYRCEAKNESGDVRVITGELDTSGAKPAFTVDPIAQEVVTCTIWNSYDYQPAIALTKVNAPTEVRGDLTPPATVTSTYTVTNPGNTPLDNIVMTDDKCSTVGPTLAGGRNVGDSDSDGLLDPGEAWTYTCTRGVRSSASNPPDADGKNIVNTATVAGTDPEGTKVQDGATDDVDAFNPAILVIKRVNGQKSVVVASGEMVDYTFAVINTGNTPLASVTLADVSTPATGCAAPPRGPDGPGNGDATLDVGETWTYECIATITASTTNTATVTGTPLNPVPVGRPPFPTPNPPVTDTDRAEVTTIDPALTLTKDVDKSVVFPGTSVTYDYTATNEGDTDLRNDTVNPGWLTDDKCSPVDGVPTNPDTIGDGIPTVPLNAGDTNGDDLLNHGETWEFTCAADILADTLNTATIVAQPVVGGQPAGGVLTRTADALVEVVKPGIHLVKTALKPVVLDPDTVHLGPKVPDPAEYLYEVTNTGTVPLRAVTLVDDTCSPIGGPDGDLNSDAILQVDEVWTYGCRTNLQRQQGTPPPDGALSGNVTNTARVLGTPFLPEDPTQTAPQVSDTDKAQVLVIEPSLSIEKTVAPEVVLPGGKVTYTFKVRNTGDVGLRLVGPTDDKCAPLSFVGGDTTRNSILDGADSGSPETWTFTCTRSIGLPQAPATTDTNSVSVKGVDPLGNGYLAKDTAEVRVIDPAIHLVKTVSNHLVPSGTQVTYDFAVTNVGTSPVAEDDLLAKVTLGDIAVPAQPACASPTLVAKEGGNQDDFLDRDPAETWRYECASTITAPTTNVALVRGLGGTQFGFGVRVFAAAAAFVQPFHPGIDVVKTAAPTEVLGGGEVTYTYQVRNTGDVPLADVADRITDDTCTPVTYVSGDQDADGLLDTPTSIFEDALDETWTFTCTTTVNQTTTNTVTTPGTPVDPDGKPLCGPTETARVSEPCDATDTDQQTVTVIAPGTITITKKTQTASTTTFGFTFNGTEFTLQDGQSRTFDGLRPGQYPVIENATASWSLTDLTCVDPTGDTTIDQPGRHATVNLAAGESIACTYTNQLIPELPRTGVTGLPALLAVGAGLLLLGTTLQLLARRRRQSAT